MGKPEENDLQIVAFRYISRGVESGDSCESGGIPLNLSFTGWLKHWCQLAVDVNSCY
jgi:hypothetical protein